MSKPLSILVIDRFNRPAETWSRISGLAGAGAVRVVADPGAGESELARGKFDLILCSYRFEDESGTEFISRMRARGMETPVIFISIVMDTKGVIEAAGIRMADFLAAPFSSDALKQRIALLCGDAQAGPVG